MSTRGRKAELKVIEGGGRMEEPPKVEEQPNPVPAHISKSVREDWLFVVADLKRRQIYTDAMLGAVEAYVTAIANMRSAQDAIDTHGQLITTPKGLLQKNPAVTMHGKAQATVMRLAAELGLTPAARSRPRMKETEDEESQGDFFERTSGGKPLLDF